MARNLKPSLCTGAMLSVIVSIKPWRSDTDPSRMRRAPARRSAPMPVHAPSFDGHGHEPQVALAVVEAQQNGLASSLLHLVDALVDVVDRGHGILGSFHDHVADLDALLRRRARRVHFEHDHALGVLV